MSRDLHDAQSERPSGTADRFPQAFPLPARAPEHRAGGKRHGQGLPARPFPDGRAVLDRICLHDGEDYVLVPVRSILAARSDNGVTTVDLDGQSLPVRCSLDRLEAALRPHGFFRSHRAFLVNLRRSGASCPGPGTCITSCWTIRKRRWCRWPNRAGAICAPRCSGRRASVLVPSCTQKATACHGRVPAAQGNSALRVSPPVVRHLHLCVVEVMP